MSGHSKWSKVKHQKATTDAVKSRAFTRASRGLTVSVREGGGITDPDKNFHLRLAIELARAVNMPKDTIERAIEKGAGTGAGSFETLLYEGYGPGGVAYVVQAATDNHQRTAAVVKHAFEHADGSLAVPGAVMYQFSRNGVLLIPKEARLLDAMIELALGAGADDVIERDDVFEVYTKHTMLSSVQQQFKISEIAVEHAELIMRPKTFVQPDEGVRQKNEQLIDSLELLDDVQAVFTTME